MAVVSRGTRTHEVLDLCGADGLSLHTSFLFNVRRCASAKTDGSGRHSRFATEIRKEARSAFAC